MKLKSLKIRYFTKIEMALLLCASIILSCTEPDDDPFETFVVETPNFISVDNNTANYAVNDTIFIETRIPNQLTTTSDIDITITDYRIDNSAPILYGNLTLYKETAFGTAAPISILSTDIINSNNDVSTSEANITIVQRYNDDENSYNSRFGIILKEAGSYFLADANYQHHTQNNSVNFYVDGVTDVIINIFSTFINTTEKGYEFTVN